MGQFAVLPAAAVPLATATLCAAVVLLSQGRLGDSVGNVDAEANTDPSLAVVMLARDEEYLLRRHLPEWRGIADCFVVGVDSRTMDGSGVAARELLAPKPTEVFLFQFEGFGRAKSELLRRTHERFPSVDYLLLAEPDMMPVVGTFDRAALRGWELVYAVHRSGKASLGSRLADSIFRNDGRWRFHFRVHETPVYRPGADGAGVPAAVRDSGWAVIEVEGSVRDGQPRAARLREELRLVDLDLQEWPRHPRLLYYAGVLRYELALELGGVGSANGGEELPRLAREAVRLLAHRARSPGNVAGRRPTQEQMQQRAAAAYYCARAHYDLLGSTDRAEKWYRRAAQLEPDFLYAHVALVHLLFKQERYVESLEVALEAEAAGQPRARLFMDSRPLQACDVPLLLSKAIYFHYAAPELRPKILDSAAWHRRAALLEASLRACPEVAGESASRKVSDIRQLQEFWKTEGIA